MHFNAGVASQKIMMELISSAGDICMIYRIYDYLEQIDQDDLKSRQNSAFHYSYFKSFGTCQFVSSTECRGPLRLCLVSGGKLLGGMSLRARLTWKGHRRKGWWKAMDRVVVMRNAPPSFADMSSSSVTMLIGTCRRARKKLTVSGQRKYMSARLLNLHSVRSYDWSGTPQDTRVSVGSIRDQNMFDKFWCGSVLDNTNTFTFTVIWLAWQDPLQLKRHIFNHVSSESSSRTLSLFKCVFCAVGHLLLAICLFSCCVLLMHHDLLSKCLITLEYTVYKLLYTSALFSIYVDVFAVQYFLLLYLRLYILRIFCSLISVYRCLQLITFSLLVIMCNYLFLMMSEMWEAPHREKWVETHTEH